KGGNGLCSYSLHD
ncbi:hypothetical protein AB1N83_014114, partial [Pleurotus pulmonarius]